MASAAAHVEALNQVERQQWLDEQSRISCEMRLLRALWIAEDREERAFLAAEGHDSEMINQLFHGVPRIDWRPKLDDGLDPDGLLS